jgi:hypothetical protein
MTFTQALLLLLVPYFALAVNALAFLCHSRIAVNARFLSRISIGFTFGSVVLVGFQVLSLTKPSLFTDRNAWVVAREWITYAPLAFCFYCFAQLGESSVRVRIFSELINNPKGLKKEDITRIYNEKAMIQFRIDRLTHSGDLKCDQGVFTIGRMRLVLVSTIIFGLKRLFLQKDSEFAASFESQT